MGFLKGRKKKGMDAEALRASISLSVGNETLSSTTGLVSVKSVQVMCRPGISWSVYSDEPGLASSSIKRRFFTKASPESIPQCVLNPMILLRSTSLYLVKSIVLKALCIFA